MPRIILGQGAQPRPQFPDLVGALADELRTNRLYAKTAKDSKHAGMSDAVRTTAIWDKWEPLGDEERVATIK